MTCKPPGWEHYTPKANSTRKWPACKMCCHYLDCTTKRLWIDGPLPCETMLEDEIGVEFDTEERSYYVIPLPVRYGVEA